MRSSARAFGLLLAALLLLAGGLQAVAALYYRSAHYSLWRDDLGRAGLAARLADRILPGADAAGAFAGRAAAVYGDADSLLLAYRGILREAPADAYRWAELARALATAGQFGPEFDLAVERALSLAPRSPAVNAVIADLAWRHAGRLSPAQSQALKPGLQATFRDQAQRYRLLDAVARARRQHAFCAEFGYAMGRKRWCDTVDADLAKCARPQKLVREHQRWCGRVLALPP